MTDVDRLKVLYLAAEAVPFAKTGGLAEVAGSLPRAIRALGHDVRVGLPRYSRIDFSRFGLVPLLNELRVPMDERSETCAVLEGRIGSGAGQTPVYLADSARYFDRQGIYMYPDDAERFVFFSRAALEMCRALEWQPDVVHCNEWHTALVPNWLKTIYRNDPFFEGTSTVYTAHNLEYQGIFGYRVLEIAGLADLGFIAHPEVAPDLNSVVDMMARGILFADIINTVSETHAREILLAEYGHGLDPILRQRRDRLFGVLNGIDTDLFDPAEDPNIAAPYDINSLEKRTVNKTALQAEAGLDRRSDAPLVGVVSRLSERKGLDLISAVADSMILQLGCQLVVMGTGELRYHELLRDLARKYPGQVAVFFTFNRPLEQRIYAGSDLFLMPSRFEPCGLNQMVAMRYGSVPIVHATGGLRDSVSDYVPATGEGTGFSFEEFDSLALYAALLRAVETFRNKDRWRPLMRSCMMADFSWDRSAERYVDLYGRAMAAHQHDFNAPNDNLGLVAHGAPG